MDQDIYLQILQNTMLPNAEEDMPLRWVYMQDNDPKHTSRRVKSWFIENRVAVMDWPAQSPDLNPIENLWTDVKEAVYIQKPNNQQELWQVVQNAWNNIPLERCQNLINPMPNRCKAVIKNRGHAIKY